MHTRVEIKTSHMLCAVNDLTESCMIASYSTDMEMRQLEGNKPFILSEMPRSHYLIENVVFLVRNTCCEIAAAYLWGNNELSS